jgi:hypothetical protein
VARRDSYLAYYFIRQRTANFQQANIHPSPIGRGFHEDWPRAILVPANLPRRWSLPWKRPKDEVLPAMG